MQKKLHYVTGNSGKFHQLKDILSPSINIQQTNLDIIEPQADSIAQIAISKAKQAFDILKEPLVVEDSGLYIEALHGLPGPYIKYMNDNLSLEQILDILHGKENRNCKWVSCLAYADKNGKIITFEDDSEQGTIAEEIYPECSSKKARSQFWRIYISGNTSKPLAALTADEYNENMAKKRDKSPVMRFADYINK